MHWIYASLKCLTSNVTFVFLSLNRISLPNLAPLRYDTSSDSLLFGPWLWCAISSLTSPYCPYHLQNVAPVSCPMTPKCAFYHSRCGDHVGGWEQRLRRKLLGPVGANKPPKVLYLRHGLISTSKATRITRSKNRIKWKHSQGLESVGKRLLSHQSAAAGYY